jgi:predicted lipoprotein with Yx(FWY)xxD motif
MLLSACAGKSTPSAGGGAKAGAITTRSISGIGTVLQDGKGFTLYHITTDTSTKISCSGSCATTWPPLLASGGSVPSGSGLPGALGTINRPDGGTQVTYNGMPLYTYSGDSAAGQANGQGIGGVWFAVTASMDGSGSSGSPSGGSGGGY